MYRCCAVAFDIPRKCGLPRPTPLLGIQLLREQLRSGAQGARFFVWIHVAIFLRGDCRPNHNNSLFAQISTNHQRMPDDEKRNRGLQAATEGNEATRITIMLIKVDPDTIGVALVCLLYTSDAADE